MHSKSRYSLTKSVTKVLGVCIGVFWLALTFQVKPVHTPPIVLSKPSIFGCEKMVSL